MVVRSTPDPRLAPDLRADMQDAGFNTEQLAARLGEVAAQALSRDEVVPALMALGEDPDRLATLIRCFLLGQAVSTADLQTALPRTGVEAAVAGGLVRLVPAEGAQIRALVDLQPQLLERDGVQTDLWFASDLPELVTGSPLETDHVLGVGQASLSLLRATVPSTGRVLDLGTGCGVQAVHAALRGAQVTATDISARALQYAAFNAALAGVTLDLRLGSLLEPVAGEQFDLVISNPPFVITPRDEQVPVYEYRDAGRTGDALVEELITSVGQVLAPGGVAQMLGNWEIHADQKWDERVGDWLRRSGLDGWVVQRDQVDAAQYVELWLRDGGTAQDRDANRWQDLYRTWMTDLGGRDVHAIGLGLVTLRRPAAQPSLCRCEELTAPVADNLGQTLAEGLAAHDRMQTITDAQLLDLHLVVAPDVTEERYLHPGEEHPEIILLRQGGGFGRAAQVGTVVAAFVGACDGELSVGSIVGALAQILDETVAQVSSQILPAARGLVLDGLLTVPSA